MAAEALKESPPPANQPSRRGGARKGAGRKPGPNRKTQEQMERAGANGAQLPLDYMLAVMRDPKSSIKRRDEMAKSAARYCHATIQAIAHSGPAGEPIQFIMHNRPPKDKK